MKAVTVYTQNRFDLLSNLPDRQRQHILSCLDDVIRSSDSPQSIDLPRLLSAARVSDLESLIDINYVDQNRDLSGVRPIHTENYFVDYDRKDFQPLLDALAVGDFELASALTPERLRLCGYREVQESYAEKEYAISGYAGDFAETIIPPGVYPVFAREFARNERENCFTNQLKDFYGLVTWSQGDCISSSYQNEEHPFPKTVVKAPYCHQVAKDLLSGENTFQIALIPPFVAQPVQFEDKGKQYVTYHIIDTDLPDLLKENPIHLRGVANKRSNSLDSMIASASQRATQQAHTGQGREWHDRQI